MFRVGDRVRITGDYSDFTNHIDGLIGEVTDVRKNDCIVTVVTEDGYDTHWLIWNYNMTLVGDTND